MHKLLLSMAAAALLATPAFAMKPPREESPAPRENLEAFGSGSSDDELDRAIAAAEAHPLGSLENPVRVAGPDGENAYLARLRCTDRSVPKIVAKAPGGPDAYGSMADMVSLDCGVAAPGKRTLAIDIYHEEHIEKRPPAGFTN
jgi:hypothetical protein